MKIVTWNVNGIRAVQQKGLLEFWQRVNPDVLCLQETKAHPDQLDEGLSAPQGWNAFWSAAQRPGYSGVATFAREVPQRVEYGIHIPKFDAEGRIVMTQFAKFALYNVYFPNGGSGPERHLFKQEFLRRFQHHLAQRLKAGDALVVLGDYNVAYLDIDVYDPVKLSRESGFLPEERQWMVQFLEAGFIDTFRYFHPQEQSRYSWWHYLQNSRAANRGWRIDHICVSRNLEKHLRSCTILDEQLGSDHCPVVLELDL
jgi:exodeoxyribonuclease-3